MKKEIRLNAFDMNRVGHIQHGMWTHPRDRSIEYNTIRYWQDLARLAERGNSQSAGLISSSKKT
jgi:long-chain alkane monooxygenase